MLGFFKKEPSDLPTQKQLNYARLLGIQVKPSMSKLALSIALSAHERRNPASKQQRLAVNRERLIDQCGMEMVEKLDQWREFADTTQFMVAAYVRRKKTHKNILRVASANIVGTRDRRIQIAVAAAKKKRDRYLGEIVDWTGEFNLDDDKIQCLLPLHIDFDVVSLVDQCRAYDDALRRCRWDRITVHP